MTDLTIHEHDAIRSRPSWPFALVLVALTALCYSNALDGPFIFDDGDAISENPQLRAGSLVEALENPRQSPLTGRPVVAATFYLNYQWGELEPFGYHVTNVAIHILTGLLLWRLLLLLLAQPSLPELVTSRARALAAVISLIWMVHPLHTDAIDYTVQRTELLMALFYVGTLHLAARAWDGHWLWSVGAVISCALGMLSKEVMISAPIMVVLMDRALRYSTWKETFQKRWLLHVSVALTWLVLVAMVASSDRTRSVSGIGEHSWNYLLAQCQSILTYLQLSVWPSGLCLDHGLLGAPTIGSALPGGIIILTLLGATVWAWRKSPPWALVGSLFFLVLAPTSSILPIVSEVAAERRMHLPVVSVITALVMASYLGLPRLLGTEPRRLAPVGLATLVFVTAAFSWVTYDRNRDFATEVDIWRDASVKLPNNPRAHQNLGVMLHKAGDLDGAEQAQRAALEADPNYPHAHVALGDLMREKGNPEEAVKHYRTAIELLPIDFKAHTNLGATLYSLGKIEAATRHLNRAIELSPWGNAVAHRYLASILAGSQQFAEAVTHFQEAIRLRPDSVSAGLWIELAWALLKLDKNLDALDAIRSGLASEPNNMRLVSEEGRILGIIGRYKDAQASLERAIAQDPSNVATRLLLARLHNKNENVEAATETYTAVLAIEPGNEKAVEQLLLIYKESNNLAAAIALRERLLLRDPNNLKLRYGLAFDHARSKNHEQAILQLRKCIDIDANDSRSRRLLGFELVQVGQTGEGLQQLEENARRHPDDVGTRRALVEFYENPSLNRPDLAKPHREALERIEAEKK